MSAIQFRRRPLSRAIALGLSSGLAFSVSALAQQTDDEKNTGLEQVMVVGQKTERSLQDTVTSVKVVTERDIQEQNINGFYDVMERTPNVTGNPGVGFTIRGIDAFNVSGGGNSFLTSVYSDGAVLPYRAIQEGAFSTWDVQQVEVLRGPQSTLQGRNALAGAIVMNTVDPGYDWTFKGRLGAGEEGREEKAVAFGGALIEDQLAIRIAAEDRDFDGYIPNVTRGENSNFEQDQTLRMKLLYEPKALPDFRALLTLTNSETDIGVKWIDPVENPFENQRTTFNDPTHEFSETDMAILKLSYKLNDSWDLTSTTAYSDVTYGYEWDGDASATPGQTQEDERIDQTLSQEFLLNFAYERVTGVLGAYYSDLDVEDAYSGLRSLSMAELGVPQLLMAPPELGGLGLSPALAQAVLGLYADFDPAALNTIGYSTQAVESRALFADATFSVSDRLDLFAGLRYDRETQANAADNQFVIANADQLPDPANPSFDPMTAALVAGLNAQMLAMADAASGTEPQKEDDFSAVLPKAGATWHWSEDMSTSFTAQKGYRSGGVASNIGRATTYSYDPEYTWNYELAFRSLWLDGRLSANANLFYVDWKDQQITVQLSENTYDTETRNVGRSVVRGAELELAYQINASWSGYTGIGYSDTEFKEFPINDQELDLSGRAFAGAPGETANLGVTYRGEQGFIFNANANYRGDALAVVNPHANGLNESDPRFDPKSDARWLVNLRTGYEWDNLGAYLTVSNLLDEEYIVQPDDGGYSTTLGAPRLATLRLEARF
ncbi:TonB-dependent receptor plug domain-containing protein [Microbulbifer sp. SH-1]|uniref:TonB-dependent receptor n=1 Tax=Microbulbifer sp. SH-1 TaxID=2681547 RepID=UPI001409713B|nr:TonB-dependent receptor [Microbulbifer sp. SH-1]QIL90749.1 TonB-dependent receptor plug domain-containing protein [Microbulbifer sp. SH-1]